MKTPLRILLWLVGLLLLAGLILEIGLDQVVNRVVDLGWQVIPAILIAVSWHLSNTFAWQACFDKDDEDRPEFWRLFHIKLVGEAVGNVTPASHVGGELAKVYILRARISATRGLPSLVVNKTIEAISGLLFAVAGTFVAFLVFEIDERVRLGLILALIVCTVVVVLAFVKQRQNTFGWLLDLLNRMRLTFLERRREQIEETDRNIAAFYRRNPRGFVVSFLFHLLSWFFGAFEIYYILTILNEPLPFSTAFLLASLSSVINAAFFFVPSGVGVFEGGHVFLFHLLGLEPALGLSVGLIRRIRKIFWIAVGFGLMVFNRRRPESTTPVVSGAPSP